MTGGPPHRATGTATVGRSARVAALLLVGAAALPGIVLLAAAIAAAPLPVALGAVGPALAWVAALLLVARPERTALPAHALAFAWGALIATWLATAANDGAVYLAGGAGTLVPILVAPLVEEAAKAGALPAAAVLRMGPARDAHTGAALGALAGLGFAMVENVGYLLLAAVQGGEAGLARAVWTRPLVGGPVHPAFSAVAGAGIASTWGGGAPRVAPLAFAAAVALHAAWNASGARLVSEALCAAPAAGAPCATAPPAVILAAVVPALTFAFVAPAAIALVAMGAARRRAGRA